MDRIQTLNNSLNQKELPKLNEDNLPDQNGYFGEYGGAFVDSQVEKDLQRVLETYVVAREDPSYTETLKKLYCDYVGRPSALFKCDNLTKKVGGAQIYLKREDLNHTGAHKINHSLGQALLAKRMGKTRILGGTGAGQHGVAMSAAAALCGLKCEVYMGAVDVAKEHPNLLRMQCMGAKVVVVHDGQASLKAASDAAFKAYKQDIDNTFYCVGSVIGPHPFPMMVRDFQSIIGKEAIVQFKQKVGQNPDHLIACVGGGCNAMGLFTAFLKEPNIKFYGVEPAGKGLDTLKHAATLNGGKPGIISGYKCYFLQDEEGKVRETHTVASGLGNPAVGPQHCHYKDTGKVEYVGITDDEAISAFFELSREEGIIPAIESSHAVAYGLKLARELPQNQHILINLSGRGDKDIDYVVETFGSQFGITEKF